MEHGGDSHYCNCLHCGLRWRHHCAAELEQGPLVCATPCKLHDYHARGIPTLQATTSSDVRKLNKSPGFYQVPPNNLTALQKVRLIC